MKLMTLAIASVVDANTRQGFTHQILDKAPVRVSDQVNHGRVIRSKSIAEVFARLAGYFSNIIEKLKVNAQRRKEINQLSSMNDHLLADIGLHRGDVQSMRAGLISLEELNARREANRVPARRKLKVGKTSTNKKLSGLQSANEDYIGLAKCC